MIKFGYSEKAEKLIKEDIEDNYNIISVLLLSNLYLAKNKINQATDLLNEAMEKTKNQGKLLTLIENSLAAIKGKKQVNQYEVNLIISKEEKSHENIEKENTSNNNFSVNESINYNFKQIPGENFQIVEAEKETGIIKNFEKINIKLLKKFNSSNAVNRTFLNSNIIDEVSQYETNKNLSKLLYHSFDKTQAETKTNNNTKYWRRIVKTEVKDLEKLDSMEGVESNTTYDFLKDRPKFGEDLRFKSDLLEIELLKESKGKQTEVGELYMRLLNSFNASDYKVSLDLIGVIKQSDTHFKEQEICSIKARIHFELKEYNKVIEELDRDITSLNEDNLLLLLRSYKLTGLKEKFKEIITLYYTKYKPNDENTLLEVIECYVYFSDLEKARDFIENVYFKKFGGFLASYEKILKILFTNSQFIDYTGILLDRAKQFGTNNPNYQYL